MLQSCCLGHRPGSTDPTTRPTAACALQASHARLHRTLPALQQRGLGWDVVVWRNGISDEMQ